MTDMTTLTAFDRARYAGRCWAILPDALLELDRLAGSDIEVDESVLAAAVEAARERGGARAGGEGQVAIVPLQGTITPEGSFLQMLLGIPGGLKAFRADLGAAVGDAAVKAIVLNIDSPGGIVDQVPETAAFVREAAQIKPIVALANPMAASAAYWIASAATQIVGSTSSETGSIGVYQLHRDLSQAHAMAGIKPTLISAGKYKVEGNPFEPLSEEAQAALQTAVDDYYNLFVGDVAAGRGVSEKKVRNGYGEGRVLTSQRAQQAGLIDSIGTMDSVVGSLAAGKLPKRRRAEDGHTTLAIDDEVIWSSADFDDLEPDDKRMDYSIEDKMRLFSVMTG